MRRIELPQKTVYEQRRIGWSVVLLVASFAAFEIAFVLHGDGYRKVALVPVAVGAVLAVQAVAFLLWARLFVVDREAGVLRAAERRLFRRRIAVVPLREVEGVWLESTEISVPGRRYGRPEVVQRILIERKGADPVVFDDDLRLAEGLARRLAEDLGVKLRDTMKTSS